VRVERLQREYPVKVEWSPFELHPETPPEGRVRQPRPGANRAEEVARAAGLVLRSPPISANSRLALEASEFAREAGAAAFDRFHRAVFRAYFEDGRNIGDREVLVDIARAAGLDGDALLSALTDRRYRAVVDEGIQWAAASGLTSTPTFIFDDRFEQVMQRLGMERRTAER
jgi:predicted DsbA family dithiol-disulfide isomerase